MSGGRAAGGSPSASRFGGTELPPEQRAALARATRLEWLTLGAMTLSVALVFIASGSSQAMKAAWIEDTLSLMPPIAFLVAARVIRRPPSARHPYGAHRAIGIAHVVAAVALLGLGLYLLVDSGSGLIRGERPPMGTVVLLGMQLWSGWLMVVTMVVVSIAPVILGHLKQRPAEQLHDKVLFADADMSKADWQSALATIVGVVGVGMGWWWADAVAAIVVSLGILRDGVANLRDAVDALMDARPTSYDGRRVDPVGDLVREELDALAWVREAGVRLRDEGHVLHCEVFLVPKRGEEPSLARLEEARERVTRLDWRLDDVVVTCVPAISSAQVPEAAGREE